ncbi:hypothetical protein [Halopseudomonas salegens]|uniref:Zinc-ribbon 15 domain-containing protein n=1 Tax=Halopseudomonas salegens TaxID=1434072 RepID=A0A1H2FA51_9GAMM|nr:hypothetical protein [Halopseudomonas salegens]SDU03848.1 hypothetical protein SAMN05216210_1383 [Halopseudomonas salegens]
MIFFGTRGRSVSGQVLEGIQCPSCDNQQFVSFGVIRHFHIYWIPMFATSKKAGIECTHCKKTLIGNEISADLAKDIKSSVFTKRNTLPSFAGLILFACLMLFAFYVVVEGDIREAGYIKQPAVNDLYLVDVTKIFPNSDPEYRYGLLRVNRVLPDQVEFSVSNLVYNELSGVRKDIREGKAAADDYYDSEPLYRDTSDIKRMKGSGAIRSIRRSN